MLKIRFTEIFGALSVTEEKNTGSRYAIITETGQVPFGDTAALEKWPDEQRYRHFYCRTGAGRRDHYPIAHRA